MKFLKGLVSVIFTIASFVILNYLTIPYLDTLDKNSFSDAVLGIIISLAHILIPAMFLEIAIFDKHDFE